MKNLLQKAKQNNVDIELFKISSKGTTVEVRESKIESIEESNETGIAIRLIKEKKLGFAYTTDTSEDNLEDIFEKALKSSENSLADEFLSINEQPVYDSLITYDREISELSIEDKIETALLIESSAYSYSNKVKKTEKASFSDNETKIEIISSKGMDLSYNTNYCGGICEVISEDGNSQENGFSLGFSKKYAGFDFEKIGKDSAQKSIELLNPKTIHPGKHKIILSTYVGAQLLESISNLFSSDAVQKGKSLFKGKLGQKLFPEFLSITDDGRLKNALFSAPFDDEGTPSRKTPLIEKGILKSFLYNNNTASKENLKSTGNGKRASYKALPEVYPTNIFFEPGESKEEEIISSLAEGIYITRVMGIHTINPISGNFSIGAQGIMIEKGTKTFPVRGITIAGNLFDFLSSIEKIGSDLEFFPFSANTGSPTILVSDISISA